MTMTVMMTTERRTEVIRNEEKLKFTLMIIPYVTIKKIERIH